MTHVTVPVRGYVSGHFTFHKGKVDADGVEIPGTRHQVADFDNLITDNGMDKIFSCPGGAFGIQHMFPRCYIGTGATVPAVTDTTLTSYLAASNTIEGATETFVDGTPAYWKNVRTYRFNAGTATGNISEVGTGWANNNLFSHALILDGGGIPTTITVLADEYLDVTYEFRNYIDKTLYEGIITISGVAYDVDYQVESIGSPPNIDIALSDSTATPKFGVYATQTLGTVYQSPSGTVVQKIGTWSTYVAGSWYADCTFTYGITEGNHAGGIGSAYFRTNQGQFQMNFTPKIPKDATKNLIITLRIIWARYP